MVFATGYTIAFVIGAMFVTPVGAQAKPAGRPAPSPCSQWLSKTNARMAKLGEQRWRNTIVDALGEGSCPAVPAALRDAARAARQVRDEQRRDRLLADAAANVLGASCTAVDPAKDSRSLAQVCPLPRREEFSDVDSAFRDIRAVDYLLINALATNLIASESYDTEARRLMLNFMLSATLLGEKRRP